ncbi:hypothetical protein BDZ85DRAFT_83497 [Elsinoe ampelina]|uniref:Zn(2)-C6 fungal-type domain-containing protein n=1 Tax=Elsinoe ampelina TaxID=302913 RepID=A0A6A6GG84_9PEZI|nr:hypothetical protein BDZ85DRAFT_83497 [Elsinoe ampelina]
MSTIRPYLKRPHKKSRAGCVTCRQRRIKCDEGKPSCTACLHRSLVCTYPSVVNTPSADAVITFPFSSHRHVVSSSVGISLVMEVNLSHHYLSQTCYSLASTSTDPYQRHRWCTVVPALATTSTSVKNGMLTLAACHQYFDGRIADQVGQQHLLELAIVHYHKCVQDVAHEVRFMKDSSCLDSVVSASMLLFVTSLAFGRIERTKGRTVFDSEYWSWLPLLRGISTIHNTIRASELQFRFRWSQDMTHEIDQDENESFFERPAGVAIISQSYRHQLQGLRLALAAGSEKLDVAQTAAYEHALDYLARVFDYMCDHTYIRSVLRVTFIWPCQIEPVFAAALMKGETLALTIYAQWLLLVVLLEDVWLVGDMGRSGISEVLKQIHTFTLEQQHLLLETDHTLQQMHASSLSESTADFFSPETTIDEGPLRS